MERVDWEMPRRETAYTEAQRLIDAQHATMREIDEKAMRTVRLTAVLVGLILAALQVNLATFHFEMLIIALLMLVTTVLTGIATYDESELYAAPDGEYLEQLSDGALAEPWHQELLWTYAGMAIENTAIVRRSALLLRAAHVGLSTGVIIAIASVLF